MSVRFIRTASIIELAHFVASGAWRAARSAVAVIALALVFASASAQEAAPAGLGFLMQALVKSDDPATQLNLLRGINKALEGRRNVPAPKEWETVAAKLSQSASPEVREQVQTLGAVFGSSSALDGMRKILADANADRAAREKALESLLAAKDKDTLALLLDLAKQPGPLRRAAIRGLAVFDDPRIPETIIGVFASLDTEERRDALGTLLGRAASAKALVAALEAKQIALTDLAAPQIRQLSGYNEPQIERWLRNNPALTISASNKQAEIARYKTSLTPEAIKKGDVHYGRALYTQICAACHRLFDSGADIGPELTGSNRTDLDYLLQNILDPNALIGKDYQSTTVETKDGRILVGIVRADDENTLALKTLAGPVIVPRGDVKSVSVSEVSMMPEGLLAALQPDQVRDLFAYLSSPRQVAPLITSSNAADFFNGSDFTRWRISSDAWKIVGGEIIGRGNAQRPETLTSEMIAADFKLTAQLKVTGEKAAAEIILRGGSAEQLFRGFSLSFGGPSPSNLWIYLLGRAQPALAGPLMESGKWTAFEVEAIGPKVQVKLDGKEAFTFSAPGSLARTIPAFYLFGEGAELAIKDLKMEVAQ